MAPNTKKAPLEVGKAKSGTGAKIATWALGSIFTGPVLQLGAEMSAVDWLPDFAQTFALPILAVASAGVAFLVAAVVVALFRRFAGYGLAGGIGAAIGNAS